MPNDYLFENEGYAVIKVQFTDPVLSERIDGYGIVNKITGIREAECRRWNTALTFCAQFHQEDVDRAARELEAAQEQMEFPIQ